MLCAYVWVCKCKCKCVCVCVCVRVRVGVYMFSPPSLPLSLPPPFPTKQISIVYIIYVYYILYIGKHLHPHVHTHLPKKKTSKNKAHTSKNKTRKMIQRLSPSPSLPLPPPPPPPSPPPMPLLTLLPCAAMMGSESSETIGHTPRPPARPPSLRHPAPVCPSCWPLTSKLVPCLGCFIHLRLILILFLSPEFITWFSGGAPAVWAGCFFFLFFVSFHQNSSLGSACGCSSCFGFSFTLLTGLCYGDSCTDRWVRFFFPACLHVCSHTHARTRTHTLTRTQTHRSRSLPTISICTSLLAHGLRLFRRQRRLRDREGRRGGGALSLFTDTHAHKEYGIVT